MRRRWWKWLLAVGLVPLVVWGCDRMQIAYWVGRTDLEVEFVITDVGTGQPIPGARVEVHSEGGFYEEQNEQEFVLIADADGVARKECRRSMCFGAQSGYVSQTPSLSICVGGGIGFWPRATSRANGRS